jgi:hypothetical protein
MARRPASKAIPDRILALLLERLKAHAVKHWPSCVAVSVRTRGAFAYVDVQAVGESEPEPIFRLRYLGGIDTWEFAYFTWGREAYELSCVDSGSPFGTPEECFDAAAHSVLSS